MTLDRVTEMLLGMYEEHLAAKPYDPHTLGDGAPPEVASLIYRQYDAWERKAYSLRNMIGDRLVDDLIHSRRQPHRYGQIEEGEENPTLPTLA